MFGIGMPEMLLILAIALIVIGPKKLPDLARSMGRALGEFKRATSDIKESIQRETGLGDVKESLGELGKDIKESVDLKADIFDGPPEKESTAGKPASNLEKVRDQFEKINRADDRADGTENEKGQAPTSDGKHDQNEPAG